ncbi:MAG: WYL domain-containing protein [Actinomycetota bacterium]|nr:WYL domain-containing protein [Actinomycetota bacterium]MED5232923.1 WYL domain-containing protein [Actinomycetota bacterium]
MAALPAMETLVRLLNLVTWLAERGEEGASPEEVARRFDYPMDQLLIDLEDLQYVDDDLYLDRLTTTDMFDFEFTEQRIRLRHNDLVPRPLGVRREELAEIHAMAREVATHLEGEGDEDADLGPLERAVLKLSTVLGPGADSVQVDVLSGVGRTLGLMEEAILARRCVEMDYYSYDRDEMTHRVVEPYRCIYAGFWYLLAHCRHAEDFRLFRLDRVRDATRVDEAFEPPAEVDEGLGGVPIDGSLPEVTLDLDRSARWVADQYPTVSVEESGDGDLRVVLPVAAVQWLERLLLRLGPAATVVDAPTGLGKDLRSAAAARILNRYA